MAKFGRIISLDLTSQQKLGAIQQDKAENSQPSKQKPRHIQHCERTAQKTFQRLSVLPLPFQTQSTRAYIAMQDFKGWASGAWQFFTLWAPVDLVYSVMNRVMAISTQILKNGNPGASVLDPGIGSPRAQDHSRKTLLRQTQNSCRPTEPQAFGSRHQNGVCPAKSWGQGYPKQKAEPLLVLDFLRDLSILSSFLYLPSGMGISILCLFNHCILEAHNMFEFTDSTSLVQSWEKFVSRYTLTVIQI